jgi:DNA invertase Pin-like site-specific DNA recombinase
MPAHSGKFVSYIRVSTDAQGRSGLGLEAQRAAVKASLNGGSWKIVGEFVEVESGKRAKRPELEAALAACKKHRAKLIVAKLDRLARNTKFLLTLLDSGVEVLFCDMPQVAGAMGRFTVTQMAAVAELEAGLISERTKAALAAAKERGVELGANGKKLAAQFKAEADERAEALRDTFVDFVKRRYSFRGMADELTRRKIAAPNGSAAWNYKTAQRMVKRLSLKTPSSRS